MISAGEIFTLIPYAQLILENAKIYNIDENLMNEIGRFLVKDFSSYAYDMILEHDLSDAQRDLLQKMMKTPDLNRDSFNTVWKNDVLPLKDAY